MPRRLSVAGAALIGLMILAGSGCGIRDEARPHVLRDAALPIERVPAEAAPEEAGPVTLVFLVGNDRLVPVGRPQQTGVAAAVRLLIAGPRETEVAFGLRSAIPTGTNLLGAEVTDGVAVVDLSEAFTSVVGPEQILATAQLVFTVTAIPGVDAVELAIAGERVDVARGDGTLAAGAVRRADYATLAAG